MKTLILFRHGKSDWSGGGANDHARPVAERGVRASRLMGRLLRSAGQVPDSIVTSSAVRARTSVELAAEAGGWEAPVRVTRALYDATPFAVLEEVKAEPDATRVLLLAGHQPTWGELASLLVSGGNIRFPTAAMVCIDLHVDSWKSVAYSSGELVWLMPPKFFTRGDFDFARG